MALYTAGPPWQELDDRSICTTIAFVNPAIPAPHSSAPSNAASLASAEGSGTTSSASARHHLLDCGERLVARKGFVGVGLAEILATAGVPKGSFYHYFASKERFGEALLMRYTATYLEQLDRLLRADGTPARVRLMRYSSHWNVSQCDSAAPECGPESTGKCLIVKLSAEVADISEAMRLALRDGTEQVVQRIADCIEEGRADGSLPTALPPHDTALTLYQLWLGASLLAKLRRDGSALDHALRSTERLLGTAPPPS